MKRTLMAVGIAVLVSMLFAPHAKIWQFMDRTFGGEKSYQQLEERPNPEFLRYQELKENPFLHRQWDEVILPTPPPRTIQRSVTYTYHWTPDWDANLYWFPIFVLDEDNHILWGSFIGQTAFLAVLAAVLVNLRWRKHGKES